MCLDRREPYGCEDLGADVVVLEAVSDPPVPLVSLPGVVEPVDVAPPLRAEEEPGGGAPTALVVGLAVPPRVSLEPLSDPVELDAAPTEVVVGVPVAGDDVPPLLAVPVALFA